MQNNFTVVLSTLGVIFIGLILVAGGFYLATESGWTLPTGGFFSKQAPSADTVVEGENTPFSLSEEQKQALVAMGVDPAKVPTSITPTQRACFVAGLGEDKFNEIQNGAVPSTFDLAKVKSCL